MATNRRQFIHVAGAASSGLMFNLGTALAAETELARSSMAEADDDLAQTNWQTLITISNLPSAIYPVNDPSTNQARFYRLQRPAGYPAGQ